MMKKTMLLLFMIILSLTLTVGWTVYCLCYNINLMLGFNKVEGGYNYADAVEQEAIDLNEISKLFTNITTAYKYPDYRENIISPVKIEYYKSKSDKSPIYIIEKGEIIHCEVFTKTRSRLQFRGNDSIPTNEKGWRIARPFKVDGEEKDSLWYVKLEDLICVNNEWLKENPSFTTVALREGLLPTKRNISKFMLLFVDRELYSNGIFLSKDMYRPILNRWNVIGFFVTIILIVINIFLKKRFWR